MKRAVQIIVLVLFLAFIAIQFVRSDFTNPAIVDGQTLEATVQVPEDVEKILTRSCADCHTSNTNYPWYSKIQPSAWLLAGHIRDGRQQLNFSEWGSYENRRKKRKLGEICEQVETKEMPLSSYLWIHRDAKMSAEEIKKVCDWTQAEEAKIDASTVN